MAATKVVGTAVVRASRSGVYGAAGYRLLDRFGVNAAAGSVNGTKSDGTGSVRSVTDTGNYVSVGSGVASFAGGNTSWTANTLSYPADSRIAGRLLKWTVTPAQTNKYLCGGWGRAANNQPADGAILFTNGGAIRCDENNTTGAATTVGVYTAAEHQLAVALRAAGSYYFVKGGAFSNWTLLYLNEVGNTAALYPTFVSYDTGTAYTIDNVMVPPSAYKPPVALYDDFTRGNGAIGSSLATGPEGQPCTAVPWGSTWVIATNQAAPSPTLGSDVIVNGGFGADTDWTKGAAWTISSAKARKASGTGTEIYESKLTANLLYQAAYTIDSISGSTLIAMFGSSSAMYGPSRAAPGTFTETGIAVGSVAGFTSNSTTVAVVDNVSYVNVPWSDAISAPDLGLRGVLNLCVPVKAAALDGLQNGAACNVDSQSNPKYYLLGYLDGRGNGVLDKFVNGVRTNLVSAAVTYAAGKTLVLVTDQTDADTLIVRLFYNNTLVGTAQTLTRAGGDGSIIDATRHGTFSSSPSAPLAKQQVMARGNGGEYTRLGSL